MRTLIRNGQRWAHVLFRAGVGEIANNLPASILLMLKDVHTPPSIHHRAKLITKVHREDVADLICLARVERLCAGMEQASNTTAQTDSDASQPVRLGERLRRSRCAKVSARWVLNG
jgi:hypothetical protein